MADESKPRRDVVIEVGAAGSARASGHPPVVTISTPLWFFWCQIAHEQVAIASDASTTEDLHREILASMIAIVASAFAIDGIYGTIKKIVTPPPTSDKTGVPPVSWTLER